MTVQEHGDQPLPEPYAVFQTPHDAEELVIALLLTSAGAGDSKLGIEILSERDQTPPDQTGDRPGCAARDFLRFYLSNARVGHSPGARIGWRWTRDG